MDRDQGFILTKGPDGQEKKVALMTLSVGEVSPTKYDFADIREITEMAAEARRKND
jgi:hypothetical protein